MSKYCAKNTKVSLITVVFNNVFFIEDSIKSILTQSYRNIEIIIIDGGSSDGTVDIIKKYRNHLSVFISEEDSGVYSALNKGINFAKGDIIGILHSDDIFEDPFVIEDMVNNFDIAKYDGIYGDVIHTKRNNEFAIHRYWKSGIYMKNSLKFGWMIPHPALFLKVSVYKDVGKYNEKYQISADYDFIVRLLQSKFNLIYYPRIICKMRTGGKSSKDIRAILKKFSEDLDVIRKNKIGGFYTLIFKNFFKVSQFFNRPSK